jgi:homogentisate 1,2-dioxygenase
VTFEKGNLPQAGKEVTELYEQSYTRKGFFGPYARLYKTRDPGQPVRAADELQSVHLDLREIRTGDLERADGLPAPVVTSDTVALYASRRRAPMPYCWRNADADALYFLHRGPARFETDFGHLTAEPGDFVYLPRNVIYRVVPLAGDTIHLILETRELLESAEPYHRRHGMTSLGFDPRAIVVPEVVGNGDGASGEHELRTKKGGKLYSSLWDHDPVGVTVGWAGDPIVFKLSSWAVPAARSPFTPATSAVFTTPDAEDCVVSARRGTTGRAGAPGHSNDWDELWFLHAATKAHLAPNAGILRWDPQGVTQTGSRYTHPKDPKEPPDQGQMNLNIDVRAQLRLSKEAEACAREGSYALDP